MKGNTKMKNTPKTSPITKTTKKQHTTESKHRHIGFMPVVLNACGLNRG